MKKLSATVHKVWDDDNDRDGLQPESLKVTLSNGTEVILSAEVGWEARIDNLPKYENHGDTIQYSFTEKAVSNQYQMTGLSVNGKKTTITNTWMPDRFCLSVLKVWNDNNNLYMDNFRKEGFYLLEDTDFYLKVSEAFSEILRQIRFYPYPAVLYKLAFNNYLL